ncbi:MAG: hypothetical protein IPF98_21835 [Gemmatimonadetes bacterium]|nr:hypothetical protein [Gemmatimonadota bacterium]MCC6774189.1 hypothetical protein [Gemmatimonadaceae bacterium]
MAELAFLDAVSAYLGSQLLTPAVSSGRLGVVEPFVAADLPGVVLSLDESTRLRIGLGERADLMTGALPVRRTIDLAEPRLPEDPSFPLLDAGRRRLILPHGGQVRADGTEGALGAADLVVTLGATSFVVVAGVPAAGEVRADAATGLLEFGAPLPATGVIEARYFLGSWERRAERITGRLRVQGCASNAADAASVLASAIGHLLSPAARSAIRLLPSMTLTALSAVTHHPAPAGVAPVTVAHFRRHATFAFEFQHLIDQPESSGGIIGRIPIITRLDALHVDRATGAIQRAVETVP